MDSNNLLTDFLDNYFNDPLSDDNNLKPKSEESSSSLPRPQFHQDGKTLNPDTSMSTPNHHTGDKVSPCYEINYGPIMSHADAFSSSTPSLNPLFSLHVERSDSNTALDDIWKSPNSPSSSTISIRSPIPPPTPSPERLQCLPDIDINNNSNGTISADDEEEAITPELVIEESQPSPLMVSASPLVTFTIPDSVMTRSDDVLEHHFDVQLSPAMAAQCTDTSTHGLHPEEQTGASCQEPVEIYTMQGTTFLRSRGSDSPKPSMHSSEEQSSATGQEKSLEMDPKTIPERSLTTLSEDIRKSPRCGTSPVIVRDRDIDVEKMEKKSLPFSPPKVPVFKTDLTKFASRIPNQVSVIVTATQSGQNIIPLAKDTNQRDRLWHVDNDDPFRDVPIVKASPEPRKRRGRPRGSKNKRSAVDLGLTASAVCARCVELSQQIRRNPQVLAMVCEECGRSLSPGDDVLPSPAPVQVTYKDVASATKRFQTVPREEVKVNRIPPVEIALEGPKMVCWKCHSDDSHGPWHRNKHARDKFLCNRCFIAMYEQRRMEATLGPSGYGR